PEPTASLVHCVFGDSPMKSSSWVTYSGLRRIMLFVAPLCAFVLGGSQPVFADDVQNLADKIDRRIDERLKSDGVVAAPIADDAEYLRRVSLHIAGTIPPVAETRKFLREDSDGRRRKIVDELLESPHYITNFSNFWTRVMMPESATDLQG